MKAVRKGKGRKKLDLTRVPKGYPTEGGKVDEEIYTELPPEALEVFKIKKGSEVDKYIRELREALRLFNKGLSPIEISTRLGIPVTTLRERLKVLAARGVTSPEQLDTDDLLEIFKYITPRLIVKEIGERVRKLEEMGYKLYWNSKKRVLALPKNAEIMLERVGK